MKKFGYIAGITLAVCAIGTISWSVFYFAGGKTTREPSTVSMKKESKKNNSVSFCYLNSEGTITLDGVSIDINSFEAYLVNQRHSRGDFKLLIEYVDTASNEGRIQQIKRMIAPFRIETDVIKKWITM